jgi:hypothetical protein
MKSPGRCEERKMEETHDILLSKAFIRLNSPCRQTLGTDAASPLSLLEPSDHGELAY